MFRKVKDGAAIATVVALAGLFTACGQSPTSSLVAGKQAGGITADEAKAIAAEHAGGTALAVNQEDEDGTPVFEVKVLVHIPNVIHVLKEVEVRISDGVVLEMEDADHDD